MDIERGLAGRIPYAEIGTGRPILILTGGWPSTGVESNALIRGAVGVLGDLVKSRRLVVVNRWPGMPQPLTIGDVAAEYAEMIRTHLGTPVDVVGTSTGGSIAQQLAADHPDTVRRLVLISTACRLGVPGRRLQWRVAELLRSGRQRRAVSVAAFGLAPRGLRTACAGVGWLLANRAIALTDAADLAATLEAEDGFDLASCASPIQANKLIIVGAKDGLYGADLFAETADLIPKASWKSFLAAAT